MDLLSVLNGFSGRKILVIGDLILDRFIWGRVERISPEAPVPVVEVTGDTSALGGAANVANNIASLGGKPVVLGVVGKDRAAETLRGLFDASNIDFLDIEDSRPTTVKTRVIAHNQQVVRFDQEEKGRIGGKALKSLLGSVAEMVPKCDAVIVSDYKKGVVSSDVMGALLRASKGKTFIALDPKVGHFHLYKKVSVITPNLMEASHGSGIEIKDERTLLKAGSALRKKLGCEAVLITRGKDGMSLFGKDGASHIPTFARKVFDVTGAGDTVIAALALAYASGASLAESAVLANHAAGIVVGEVGTAVPTVSGIKQSLKRFKPEL